MRDEAEDSCGFIPHPSSLPHHGHPAQEGRLFSWRPPDRACTMGLGEVRDHPVSAAAGPCSECGQTKHLGYTHPAGPRRGRVCGRCYQRLTHPVAACAACGAVKRLGYHHPAGLGAGRVCAACYVRLTYPVAKCAVCGRPKRLNCAHPTNPAKGRICATCYEALTDPVGACGQCGRQKRLSYRHPAGPAHGRICRRCYRTHKRSAGRPDAAANRG